jgi:hypothetical protein
MPAALAARHRLGAKVLDVLVKQVCRSLATRTRRVLPALCYRTVLPLGQRDHLNELSGGTAPLNPFTFVVGNPKLEFERDFALGWEGC